MGVHGGMSAFQIEFDLEDSTGYSSMEETPMKLKCGKCEERKDPSEFHWRNKSKGTRASTCKECRKRIHKQHYEENREAYLEQALRRKRENKAKIDRLRDVPCAECGKRYPVVCMDFDHKDPSTKSGEIADMLGRGCSFKTILEEIEKCEVVCSNCHRIHTAHARG